MAESRTSVVNLRGESASWRSCLRFDKKVSLFPVLSVSWVGSRVMRKMWLSILSA